MAGALKPKEKSRAKKSITNPHFPAKPRFADISILSSGPPG